MNKSMLFFLAALQMALSVNTGISSEPKYAEILETAKIGFNPSAIRDWVQENPLTDEEYEELVLTCLKSSHPSIHSSGLGLYTKVVMGSRQFGRPTENLRSSFLDSIERCAPFAGSMLAGALMYTKNITEQEFLGIVAALDQNKVNWNKANPNPFDTQWPYGLHYAYAVENLAGSNPLDAFLGIVAKHPELQSRLAKGTASWIYRLDDVRAGRIIFQEISDPDRKYPPKHDYLHRNMDAIHRSIVIPFCRDQLKKDDLTWIGDYVLFLDKIGRRAGADYAEEIGAANKAVQNALELAVIFPEHTEKAMTLATDTIDTWKKSETHAKNIEKKVAEVAEYEKLRAHLSSDPAAKREIEEKLTKFKKKRLGLE